VAPVYTSGWSGARRRGVRSEAVAVRALMTTRACLVNHELGRLPPSSTKGGFGGPSRTGIRTVGEAVVPHGRFTRQTLGELPTNMRCISLASPERDEPTLRDTIILRNGITNARTKRKELGR
jgi:hypothetical protein